MGRPSGGAHPGKPPPAPPERRKIQTHSFKAYKIGFTPALLRGAQAHTSNQFLINGESLEDMDTTTAEKSTHTTVRTQPTPSSNADHNTANGTAVRKTKNQPVVVTSTNPTEMQKVCNEIVKSKKFEIRVMSIGVRISITEKDEFAAFCQHLQEKSYNYFMYHTNDTQPRKILLFGLHKMEVDKIQKILAEHNVQPTEITGRYLSGGQNQYVYTLYFAPTSPNASNKDMCAELKKISHIDNIKVNWEPYQTNGFQNLPQCRNCQLFGHSSVNCHMPTRCLVCAGEHKTANCEKKVTKANLNNQVDMSYVKCANCEEQHTANFKGCIARKVYMEIQEKKNPRLPRTHKKGFRLRQEHFPNSLNQGGPPVFQQNGYRQALLGPQQQPTPDTSSQHFQAMMQQQMQQQMQFMSQMMTTMTDMVAKLSTLIQLLTQTNQKAAASP